MQELFQAARPGVKESSVPSVHSVGHLAYFRDTVERVFGTLQDRLVKEMRLAQVSTFGQVNRFLESYLPRFNAQFEREALRPGDLHQPLSQEINLEETFCLKAQRTIHRCAKRKYSHCPG